MDATIGSCAPFSLFVQRLTIGWCSQESPTSTSKASGSSSIETAPLLHPPYRSYTKTNYVNCFAKHKSIKKIGAYKQMKLKYGYLFILILILLVTFAACDENTIPPTVVDQNKLTEKSEIPAITENTVIEEIATETTELIEATETQPDPATDETEMFGEYATVTRVVDGDTIIANINGTDYRVRFIGMDTPETVHPEKPVEPYGPEASMFTESMLNNKKVFLEYDVQHFDRFDRVLAYIWVDDLMINEQLVKEGLAFVTTYPPNVKYVERFLDAQKHAQEQKINIWSIDSNCSQ